MSSRSTARKQPDEPVARARRARRAKRIEPADVPAGSHRVMVAGATTPLGEQLVHDLLADPAVQHVLAVGAPRRSEDLVFPDTDRLTYLQVNLASSRERRATMFGPVADLRIDTVVHAAQHRSLHRKGRRARALNVESARDILHLAERHPTLRSFILRSYGEIYEVEPREPCLLDESHPIDLTGHGPQWLRDRVEADLTVCTRMGMSPLRIVVMRLAEIFCDGAGGQLHDYLRSRVCFRPLGFDPMLNLLSVRDAARALHLAVTHDDVEGVFNIPGADTLPLSRAIHLAGRVDIQVPGLLLYPLYDLRARTRGYDFSYGMNRRRFHFSGVLSGERAARRLGYAPAHPIAWLAGTAATVGGAPPPGPSGDEEEAAPPPSAPDAPQIVPAPEPDEPPPPEPSPAVAASPPPEPSPAAAAPQ